jgi:uncharacterized protein
MSAQYQLGIMYFTGKGAPQNYLKAAEFFKKAALQGDPQAQFELGVMLTNGEGIKKEDIQATEWIKKSAQQGNADAQYCLGINYQSGRGVKADAHGALYWLSKAADQGNGKAIQILKEWFSPFQEFCSLIIPVEEWENWKIGNEQKSPMEYLLEFVPLNETVDNWSQIITVSFMSNKILNKTSRTALSAMKTITKLMRQQHGDRFKLNILRATDDDTLYETFMPNPSEHTIDRLIKTSKGIYHLSYTIKGSFKDEKTKEKWLKSIQEAHLIKL